MTASLALINGRIRTMDPGRPLAEAVACDGGRILAVGDRGSVEAVVGPGTRVVNLRGHTVLPGFIDAHAHLAMLGERLLRFDLGDVHSVGDLIERAAERARRTPPGGWVVGSGWALDEFPRHDALSARTPHHPVWLRRRDGHSALANARALAIAGIDERTPDPPDGRFGRDAEGRLTGMLFEGAMERVERKIPQTPGAMEEQIEAAQREALRHGVTAVHDACVDAPMLDAYRRLEEQGRLKLRVHAMVWQSDQRGLIEHMRENAPMWGDRLSVGAIKLFMDGSLGSRSCWMLEPFLDAPADCGVSQLSGEDVYRIVHAALARGWQVCTHAIGDRANREALDAYERALAERPGAIDHRLRIEHAQHVDPDDLDRFATVGVIASMQPSHAVADRAVCEGRLGARARRGSYAWRSILAAGARIALGTDAPVETIDPRWTFACATQRIGWPPEERLTPKEALSGMTVEAAHAGFMEDVCGAIRPGLRADLAVLSDDWLDGGNPLASEAVFTVAEGEIVFGVAER